MRLSFFSCLFLLLSLPYPAVAAPAPLQGTLENSCAPWDGAAFVIRLENGINASVWAGMPDEIKWLSKTYDADNKNSSREGGGSITRCDADNTNCRVLQGSITLEKFDGKEASGHIDVDDGAEDGRYDFQVKVEHIRMFCG